MNNLRRCFAVIAMYSSAQIQLPKRQTSASAGYDLAAAEALWLQPQKITAVPTGLKAYMPEDEVLLLYIRSGLAVKHQLSLANGVGVIDADYVDNAHNEGHIFIPVINWGSEPFFIDKGQRIAQGIFTHYQRTDDDTTTDSLDRTGGFGSTGS